MAVASSNVREFNLGLTAEAKKLVPREFARLQREVGLAALTGVVLKTPVDTGFARGRWTLSLGEPSEELAGDVDPGGGTTIGNGVNTLATLRPFQAIWIVNNAPYIERLENGYSEQAPEGMLGLTLVEVSERFK